MTHGMVATVWGKGWIPFPTPGALGQLWSWGDSMVLPHADCAWRAASPRCSPGTKLYLRGVGNKLVVGTHAG